jgi:hypothetical protein
MPVKTVKERAPRSGDGARRGRAKPAAEPTSATSSERPEPWTVARAQAFFGRMARRLRADLDQMKLIHRGLPRSPDMDAQAEGRKPRDTTTEILATIECLEADDLGPALEVLERVAKVTAEQLVEEHQEYLVEHRIVQRRLKALAAGSGPPEDRPPAARPRGKSA